MKGKKMGIFFNEGEEVEIQQLHWWWRLVWGWPNFSNPKLTCKIVSVDFSVHKMIDD
jgi:hypothetical protein